MCVFIKRNKNECWHTLASKEKMHKNVCVCVCVCVCVERERPIPHRVDGQEPVLFVCVCWECIARGIVLVNTSLAQSEVM